LPWPWLPPTWTGISSRLQAAGAHCSPKLCSSNQISFTNTLQVLLHIARGQLYGKNNGKLVMLGKI